MYVHPQLDESLGIAMWANETVEAASADAWELSPVEAW